MQTVETLIETCKNMIDLLQHNQPLGENREIAQKIFNELPENHPLKEKFEMLLFHIDDFGAAGIENNLPKIIDAYNEIIFEAYHK